MSRQSTNQYDLKTGFLINGYDYENQCWVLEGLIQRCGHLEEHKCICFGKLHEGEKSQSKGGEK